MFFFFLLVLVISTESPRLAGCDKNAVCSFLVVNSRQWPIRSGTCIIRISRHAA